MKKTFFLYILANLFFCLSLSLLNAQNAQIKSDLKLSLPPEGVSVHQLDNGMEVLLIENKGLPMTGVNVVVKTGSAYETYATSGMSHMLEHLLFDGTDSLTQKELYDATDLIGAYNNANTGAYYTNYMMVTPTEYIRKGMEIQADMLFHSVLSVEKFEKEKGIVLEEIAQNLSNESSQKERNIQSILYAGHALSLPTLGTYSTIESMQRDSVFAYYKNNYVPNNMIMSVIGNFDTDSMLFMIKQIYGKEPPNLVKYVTYPDWSVGLTLPEEISDKAGKIYQRSYNGENLILQLFYPLPPLWSDTYFNILDEILSKVSPNLTDSLSTKFENIKKSFEMETLHSPIKNFLKVSAVIENKNQLNDMTNAINLLVKKLKFQISDENLKFLATANKTSFLKNLEKPHMFGIYNASLFAVGGIDAVLESYSTSAYFEAAEEMSSYFIWEDPIIILQTPEMESKAYHQNQNRNARLFFDKSSGLTLVAKENPNSSLLAIHILLKYKAQYESQSGKDAIRILHDCLGQRLNSTENQMLSNQYGLTYTVNDNPFIPMDDIYLNPDFSYIRVESLAEDVKGVIDYIKNQLSDFKPTMDEFQRAVIKNAQLSVGMGGSKANDIFTNTYKALIYEPPKYKINTDSVTYDTMNKLAAAYFHPSNMIVSVVSPLPADSIHSLFQWQTKAPPTYFKIENKPYMISLKTQTKPVFKEINSDEAQSFLFWGFTTRIEEKEKPALKALDLLLSDYIIFNVREKQGRAYRMRAGVDIVGNMALFEFNLGTRPANIDSLIPQIPGFFDPTVVESFKEYDLKKSLNMYLGRMMFLRLSSINQCYYLGYSEYFYNDINYDADFHAALKNVTLDEVKAVAQKYMIIKNPVTVIVR